MTPVIGQKERDVRAGDGGVTPGTLLQREPQVRTTLPSATGLVEAAARPFASRYQSNCRARHQTAGNRLPISLRPFLDTPGTNSTTLEQDLQRKIAEHLAFDLTGTIVSDGSVRN